MASSRNRGASEGPPCPDCGETASRVIYGRVQLRGNYKRRRRQCSACDVRFTTYEGVGIPQRSTNGSPSSPTPPHT